MQCSHIAYPDRWREIATASRNVRELRLSRMHWDAFSADTRASIIDNFQEVASLYLHKCRFNSGLDFTRLLRSSPRLQRLVVSNSSSLLYPKSTPDERPVPLRDVRLQDGLHILRLRDFDFSGLRNLEMLLSDRRAPLFLAGACKTAGTSLEHLAINSTYHIDDSVSLRHNPNLRTLKIGSVHFATDHTNQMVFLAGLLEGASTTVLKELTYTVRIGDEGRLHSFDWQRVRTAVLLAALRTSEASVLQFHINLFSPAHLESAVVGIVKTYLADLGPRVVTNLVWARDWTMWEDLSPS